MHVPEIIEVKDLLQSLKSNNQLKDWELPYENLLTRRSAAIFFVDPRPEEPLLDQVWKQLEKFENFSVRLNTEKKLSAMQFRVTFSSEEKTKNEKLTESIAKN